MATAIESFISGVNQANLETHNLETKLSGSKDEVMRLQEEVERVYAALEKAQKSQRDAEQYKDEFDQLKTRYDQSLSDATQRGEELKSIRSENTKLKKDFEAAQATIQRLQGELLTKQEEVDRIAALREELATTKNNRDRLQEALKVRDEDVAWLRSHVAQLTQQLALPPSQEEARAKSWWQFWR